MAETKTYANMGHGHVFPRQDGMVARCGGPTICKECAIDQARKQQEESGSALKQRPEDQPLPVANELPIVQDEVVQFIQKRKDLGISRYGTALQPHNGRDGLRDLLEELVDAVNYTAQLIIERDGHL